MAKVICVDDDESVARMVSDIAEFCGHEGIVCTSAFDAVNLMRDRAIKAVVADYMMPRLDGLELLLIVQEQRPDVRRILLTAAPQEAQVRKALHDGVAQKVLAKPPALADMRMALAWLDGTRE